MLKKVVHKTLPRGSRRYRFAKNVGATLKLTKPYRFDADYDRWMKWVEPDIFVPTLPSKEQTVLLSIVIPFFNTPEKYLKPLLDSIRAQSYQNWELIMADASTDPTRMEAIEEASKSDKRLKYYRLEKNDGISANTNEAIKYVKGEYVIFCDHDDTLDPHALNEVAAALREDSSIDILYSDEDKLSDNGKWRHSPYFKPSWSPHLFLNTNYTNHLSVVRRKLIEGVGGLRPEADGSQDYDLLLRIHRKYGPLNVFHVNKVLYHWREAAGSTAVNHSSKSYAFEAGRRALQDYVDTGKVKGVVINIPERPGFYNHKYTPSNLKTATVCVQISDDERVNQSYIRLLSERTDEKQVKVEYIHREKPVEIDSLRKEVKTDTLFVIRESVLPFETDWLEHLCGALELGDIDTIAPRILNADMGIVYDMGILVDHEGNDIQMYRGLAANEQTITGHVEWVADVDRLTGAVEGTVVKKESGKNVRKYHVVWSYVNFRHTQVVSKQRILNSHVYLGPKHKMKVNGRL